MKVDINVLCVKTMMRLYAKLKIHTYTYVLRTVYGTYKHMYVVRTYTYILKYTYTGTFQFYQHMLRIRILYITYEAYCDFLK